MTTNVRLIVDALTLRAGAIGPATGDIWLSIGGLQFPTSHWNDFVVVVLGGWANAFIRLLRRVSDREVVDFMEGPYLVELSNESYGTIRLRALEGSSRDREKAAASVPIQPLVKDLIEGVEAVLTACKQNDCSRDAENLEQLLSSLRTELTRSRN
jgi:hypothetical protein